MYKIKDLLGINIFIILCSIIFTEVLFALDFLAICTPNCTLNVTVLKYTFNVSV